MVVVFRVGTATAVDIGRVKTWQDKILNNLVSKVEIFESKVSLYREQGMPWLPQVLERMPVRILNNRKPAVQEKLLDTLSLISCVGLLMNGTFVPYPKLLLLLGNMALTQQELKNVGIMGVFPQATITTRGGDVTLYQLANDIHWKLVKPKEAAEAEPQPEGEAVEVDLDEIEPIIQD